MLKNIFFRKDVSQYKVLRFRLISVPSLKYYPKHLNHFFGGILLYLSENVGITA